MKNLIVSAFAVMFLGCATSAKAQDLQPMAYHGTDSLGLAIIQYQGQTYHLTEGDTLAGAKYICNDIDDIEMQVTVQGNTWYVFVPYTPATKGK